MKIRADYIKIFGKILIIIGIVALIIGIGIYLFKTKTVEVNTAPVTIYKITYYTKRSDWSGTDFYHIDEQVISSGTTQPNIKYLLLFEFPTFSYENKVAWTQAEIDLDKGKTITNVISYDEYLTLIQQPKYAVTYFELLPQHRIIYIIPGLLLLVLGTVIFLRSKEEIPFHSQTYDNLVSEPTSEQKTKITEALKNKKVANALATALHHMDTTHVWYMDEDEANRALVTSLKVMGYEEAVYHKYLGDGRTADAFFDNSIIEGKLDPQQSEVDRLEGQITEYLKYPYAVHVVLYGQIDAQLLSRIKEIVSRKPERTFLTYLPNAKRIRKRNSK